MSSALAPETRASTPWQVFAVMGAFVALIVGVIVGMTLTGIAVATMLVLIVVCSRVSVIGWPRLIGVLILVILFVPIRRYALPGNLPFQLELYRIVVAGLVLAWLASLLVDPRIRLRRTGFEGPLLLILGAALISIVVNTERAAAAPDVDKKLMFFLSFVVVLYLTVGVIRRLDDVDFLAKTLVAGGTLVALAAVYEARSGYNVFNHLSTVAPVFRDLGDVGGFARVGTAKLRVFGSAEHPIALGAMFVMLIPLSAYLARRYRQRRWYLCALVLVAACAATVSRTGILMLVVIGVVFLWLRPRETARLWPALLLAPVVIHFALPGTLGAIKQSFLPAGGLVAEQHASVGQSGSGRLADLGPAFDVWAEKPLTGQGFGTTLIVNRTIGVPETNILDDQWLTTLLEIGILGFVGWLWFFGRAVRRFGAEAKRDRSERGWLLTAITAAVAAYAFGMVTFDALAFVQVTFLLFIIVGIGASLLAEQPTPRVVEPTRLRPTLLRR